MVITFGAPRECGAPGQLPLLPPPSQWSCEQTDIQTRNTNTVPYPSTYALQRGLKYDHLQFLNLGAFEIIMIPTTSDCEVWLSISLK